MLLNLLAAMDIIYNYVCTIAIRVSNFFQTNLELIPVLAQDIYSKQENGYEAVLKAILYLVLFILFMIRLRKLWARIHHMARILRQLWQIWFWGRNIHRWARNPRHRHRHIEAFRLRWRRASPVRALQLLQVNRAEQNLQQFQVNPAEPHFPSLPNYNIQQRPQREWEREQQGEQQREHHRHHHHHHRHHHHRRRQNCEHTTEPATFHQSPPRTRAITSHIIQVPNTRIRFHRNIHNARISSTNSRKLVRVKRRQAIQSPRQAKQAPRQDVDLQQQIRNICVLTIMMFSVYCIYLYLHVIK
ncbi:uncharacterized protein LOC111721606 isoform X1 [Sarcophilus harrisii]|uniref:uncharacterized protein LOC111721606 isoform X1 n=1 Tax=Sarcophilus harrisii TaxID=9305 RepID=UPI001301CA9C|nr:uncharacterized protein LOC111721606 isoform X1 [Sarcophilus harrisii]